jgi:hypothetical protein
MRTHNSETHIVYLRAQYVVERAHTVYILTCEDSDPMSIEYERRRLLEECHELQDAMRDAGLID